MRLEELAEHGVAEEVLRLLRERGVRELFPPQREAVERGLLRLERNFVIAVPTASGKTLLAELVMMKSLMEQGGKCMYIVPLRALAAEKVADFSVYRKLGIEVAASTGDYDASDENLRHADIVVCTSEKADSLLRHGARWLGEVRVVVADEVHLLNDSSRGPTLEVTLARLKRHARILALSATVGNAGEIARWLNAELVVSQWRPVRLLPGVCVSGKVRFTDGRVLRVRRVEGDDALGLAVDAAEQGAQALVFLNTRRSAESFAERCGKVLGKRLRLEEALEELAKRVEGVLQEPTKVCRRLASAVRGGAAFHHAGLAPEQRALIERGFREGLIRVLCATPTLAAGVNLPARRVILRQHRRYEAGMGYVELPVMEVKQMMGRAGRPGYDTIGEAVLIARSEEEAEELERRYIHAEAEPVYSRLGALPALRMHVLSTIASGAGSMQELMEFFEQTFYGHQQGAESLRAALERVVTFLAGEGFVRRAGEELETTVLGRRVSQLYIDPLSASELCHALREAEHRETCELSYLHAVSRCTELGSLYLRKGEAEEYLAKALEVQHLLLYPLPDYGYALEHFLSELKTAMFLLDWVEERGEEYLLERYSLAPGDVHTRVELAEWLLYAMREMGRLLGSGRVDEIERLRLRMRYGVREELIPFVSIRNVGRRRARLLHSRFGSIEELRSASTKEIAAIPGIGEKLARSIKEQLS